MGWAQAQGRHRLLCPSVAAGAARLLRWWGKVGMSSGSQAVGEGQLQGWSGEGAPGGACSRSRQDSTLKLTLTHRLPSSFPIVPALGSHPIGTSPRRSGELTQGLLLEVGTLQAVSCSCPGE